jgi:hypothetical protein
MVGIAQPVEQRAIGLTVRVQFYGITSFSFVLFSYVLLPYALMFLHSVLIRTSLLSSKYGN